MANNFKSAVANAIGTTPIAVFTTGANSKSILIELDVANISDDTVMVSVGIGTGSSISTHIIKNAVIPTGDSLQVVAGQKIVLDGSVTPQKVFVVSNAAASVDCICSLLDGVQ